MASDKKERIMQQPIIGFVVDNDETVVKCVGCTATEDNCVDKIRDGEDYGTTIAYPECNECGEVIRPYEPDFEYETVCPYCGDDYKDPNDIASNGYMKIGHMIMDCKEIPQKHREYLNRESGHDEQPEGLFNNDE